MGGALVGRTLSPGLQGSLLPPQGRWALENSAREQMRTATAKAEQKMDDTRTPVFIAAE